MALSFEPWTRAYGAEPTTIGFLFAGTLAERPQAHRFWDGLKERGYRIGENLRIEVREARSQIDRLPELASELVQLNPNTIVAATTPGAIAAKNATRSIPIVIVIVNDPVRSKLIESLSHPGGNVTGLSLSSDEMPAKRLQLIKELIPNTARVGVLWNEKSAQSGPAIETLKTASPSLGVALVSVPIRDRASLDVALNDLTRERVDAVLVIGDPLTFDARGMIASRALANHIPVFSTYPEEAADGAVMAYGPSLAQQYHRAAYYVDRLLKGAKPTDLPVEQPTTFELAINLKSAKALGLTVPQIILARADEVIE